MVTIADIPNSAEARMILTAHAMISMYANGECSLSNIERSCFCAEHCQRTGRTSPDIAILLCGPTIVAFDENKQLLGWIGYMKQACGTIFLHSFCVPHQHRCAGIGKLLLETVISRDPTARYKLTVITPTKNTRSAIATAELAKREKRLLRLYNSFGFKTAAHENDYVVMVRSAIANS